MDTNKKIYFNLSFLFLFLLITASANFLHTEKTLIKDDTCPACQFQTSSLTTAHIHFFFLPTPSFLSLFHSFESFNYTFIFSITPNSRSPPQV